MSAGFPSPDRELTAWSERLSAWLSLEALPLWWSRGVGQAVASDRMSQAAVRFARPARGETRGARVAAARCAASGLSRYLETPIAGLWRDRQRPDGGFVEAPAPASSLYHLIGAIHELAA